MNAFKQFWCISVHCTMIWRHQFFSAQPFSLSSSHIHTWLEKSQLWLYRPFIGKVMFLLFNKQSRFVIAFLPGSKHLLISWLQSLSTMILEPRKINSVTVSIVSPSTCHEVMGPEAIIFIFWMLSFTLYCLYYSKLVVGHKKRIIVLNIFKKKSAIIFLLVYTAFLI